MRINLLTSVITLKQEGPFRDKKAKIDDVFTCTMAQIDILRIVWGMPNVSSKSNKSPGANRIIFILTLTARLE